MLNWNKRISEWASLVRERNGRVPWLGMVRAIMSGPVPADVWRTRIRTCIRCELYDSKRKACLKQLSDGRTVGCGCAVVMKAFTANPYGDGCWGHSIAVYVGWPKYAFASTRAKWGAVWRFIFPSR